MTLFVGSDPRRVTREKEINLGWVSRLLDLSLSSVDFRA